MRDVFRRRSADHSFDVPFDGSDLWPTADPLAARGPVAAALPVGLAAVAAGALTLVDPAQLSGWRRGLYRGATAAVTGALTWAVARDDDELDQLPPEVATAIAAAGLALAGAPLAERADAGLRTGLERLGVARPRLVLAGLAVGGTLAGPLSELVARRYADRLGPDDGAEGFDAPVWEERAVDEDVRALVDAILARTEDYGALALRAQLARATTTDLPREDDPEAGTSATFEVPEDVPLAVPAQGVFPVRARYPSAQGEPMLASVHVEGGRLGMVISEPVDPDGDDLADFFDDASPVAWPRPDDVTFWIDTRTGPEPIVSAPAGE